MRRLPFHLFRAYPSLPCFVKILLGVDLVRIDVSSLGEEVNGTGKLALMVSVRSRGRAEEILRLAFHGRRLRWYGGKDHPTRGQMSVQWLLL